MRFALARPGDLEGLRAAGRQRLQCSELRPTLRMLNSLR